MKKIKLQNCDKYVIVDDDDYLYLSRFNWYLHKAKNDWYVCRKTSEGIIYMSSLLIQGECGKKILYKNKNTLDLRKENIILSTASLFSHTGRKFINKSSKYKGVNWHKRDKKWRAMISKNRKSFYLGTFDKEESAAKAYNIKAIEIYGELAYQNKI